MSYSTESDCSSFPNVRLIEQALKTLKQSISTHLEQETRLERLCLGWQQSWLSQFEQLRTRVEKLEARLAPWMTDHVEGPRLALMLHQEEVA